MAASPSAHTTGSTAPISRPSWISDWPNLAIVGLIFAVSGYSIWVGRLALHGDTQSLPSILTSSSVNTAATPVPELKLNENHQRIGQEIQVDVSQIGKSDPFSR